MYAIAAVARRTTQWCVLLNGPRGFDYYAAFIPSKRTDELHFIPTSSIYEYIVYKLVHTSDRPADEIPIHVGDLHGLHRVAHVAGWEPDDLHDLSICDSVVCFLG